MTRRSRHEVAYYGVMAVIICGLALIVTTPSIMESPVNGERRLEAMVASNTVRSAISPFAREFLSRNAIGFSDMDADCLLDSYDDAFYETNAVFSAGYQSFMENGNWGHEVNNLLLEMWDSYCRACRDRMRDEK